MKINKKKNHNLKYIAITISILFFISFSFSIKATSTDQYQEFKFQKDLINQVVTYNLGYLTICVGILFGIGIGSYFSNIKPIYKKIEESKAEILTLKEELKKRIERQEQEINKIKNDVIKEIKNQLSTALNKIDYQQLVSQAQIARLFAISAGTNNIHNKSCTWWLSTAIYSNKIDPKDKKVIDSIRFAKEELEEILNERGADKKFEIKQLKESLNDIEEDLKILSKEYPEQIEEIRNILKKLLK